MASDPPDDLVFLQTPVVRVGGFAFVRVPTILQVLETPLIEVVDHESAGKTTQFAIYHPDGTYLARVKGARIFATEAGEKSGLRVRHFPNVTACELGPLTLFELRRREAAAVGISAELYTPRGSFVTTRQHEAGVPAKLVDGVRLTGHVADERGFDHPVNMSLRPGRTVRKIEGPAIGLLVLSTGDVVVGAPGYAMAMDHWVRWKGRAPAPAVEEDLGHSSPPLAHGQDGDHEPVEPGDAPGGVAGQG